MAFPSVTVTHDKQASAVTSHVIPLPASTASGDILLIVGGFDGAPTVTWDDTTVGTWTSVYTGASNHTSLGYWLVCDGSEGGESLTVTTSAAEPSLWSIFHITGAQSVEASTPVTGNSSSPNPATLSPSWGAEDTLWIALYTNDNEWTASAYPTDYGNTYTDNTGGAGGVGLSHARRELNTATQDPSAFTSSGFSGCVAVTIAVQPAAAPTGPRRIRPATMLSAQSSTIAGTGAVA